MISLEWSKTENVLEGEERRYFYKPETAMLYYTLSLNESWSIGASLWKGSDQVDTGRNQFILDESHSGGALNASYYQGGWGVNVAISAANSEIDIRSPVSAAFYEEQNKNRDANVSVDYRYTIDRVDIVPSLGLGIQTSTFESATLQTVSFTRNEDQTRSYMFTGLGLSTWFELSRTVLCLPSLQFGWTESLSGESSTGIHYINRRGNSVTSNSSNSNLHEDGSGHFAVSLAFLIEDFQLRFSHSEALALDDDFPSSAVEFGVTF